VDPADWKLLEHLASVIMSHGKLRYQGTLGSINSEDATSKYSVDYIWSRLEESFPPLIYKRLRENVMGETRGRRLEADENDEGTGISIKRRKLGLSL
jgi:hypothetical protein